MPQNYSIYDPKTSKTHLSSATPTAELQPRPNLLQALAFDAPNVSAVEGRPRSPSFDKSAGNVGILCLNIKWKQKKHRQKIRNKNNQRFSVFRRFYVHLVWDPWEPTAEGAGRREIGAAAGE